MVGKGFALVVADSSAVNSILVHKSNEDKIMVLDSHKLIGASGEVGDRAQFTEYVQKNVALYQYRNGIPVTTKAAANFMRGELATALRKLYAPTTLAPAREAYFTLQDLKGNKLSGSCFIILFNLNKFMAFESRDPFLIRQERGNPTRTEWDRFAHREYIRLSMEEDADDAKKF